MKGDSNNWDSNNCDPNNYCQSGMWYCEEGKSLRGCQKVQFPRKDCVKQCFKISNN